VRGASFAVLSRIPLVVLGDPQGCPRQVENGSSAEIIFADAFDKMGLSIDLLQPPDTALYRFAGRVIHALGKVVLPVSFGTIQNARTEYLSFDVVEMYYPYNGILGKGFLNKFEAVIHRAY
jgi:hypothetical protein